ncbi:uncharacterized protein LOC142772324 [Rhipicephalus microplus]|uniref:uncharacterized protein LOC142772324 n=1 Tax=Rhipicephalus microplus TaxID=6941 RepID=UPI003F6C3AED
MSTPRHGGVVGGLHCKKIYKELAVASNFFGTAPYFNLCLQVAPDREDDVSRQLKETLGDVDKALWLLSYYHVYGIAGTKAAPPTPTPPTVSEPTNGSSSTSSVQNGSATGCQEDPIPNPEPTCLPALGAASSAASTTNPLLEPSSQELPNGLDVRQPTAHAPCGDVNKENSSVSAQKQSYANSSSLAMHTETKDPEADSTKFSSVPNSQGLPNGLVVRQPTAHAPSVDLNKESSSISAQKQSSADSSTLTVHTEAKDLEAGSTKFSLVPKSLGLTSGRVVRPSTSRAISKNVNKEDIFGLTQHESSTSPLSLMVHKETKSPETGSTKFSSVPKSQGLPSGLVVRPPTARAPCKDVNKENSSVSAQTQLSADSSSVRVHTETEDPEAGRTRFSSVPKSQGLPSGTSCRSTTYCPCTLQRCEQREQFRLSTEAVVCQFFITDGAHRNQGPTSRQDQDFFGAKEPRTSEYTCHSTTHCRCTLPECERRKPFHLSTARVVYMFFITADALRKQNPRSRQHRMFFDVNKLCIIWTEWSKLGNTAPHKDEDERMQSTRGAFNLKMNFTAPTILPLHAERAALREQAPKTRALRVHGLAGGDPGECPPLLSPVKVLLGQEDDLSRRVQDALGDLNVALWLFAHHRDHLYGLAGNKVAQQTRTPPAVGKPVNGRSSTSSTENGNAMEPGGTKSSCSNRSSSLSTEQHHSNRASSSGGRFGSGGSTHPASHSNFSTCNQQQISTYGPSSGHLSRHNSSYHSKYHHPRQQLPHPPQSLMGGQYKPSTTYSSSAAGTKSSRHSAKPLQSSWPQPHQSTGSSSEQDAGETRSSSNRSSSLTTDQHHSYRTSSSGRSAHLASQSSTRNQQQSSRYEPSSSNLARHDNSRHSGNHHTTHQLLHHPQSLMNSQYKPSLTSSSASKASKNSTHSAQPLQGSWLQPHQSRRSSYEQGWLGEATSNPKKRSLPSSSAASSAASTTNSSVPPSSQGPRNDLVIRPPAKRARRL